MGLEFLVHLAHVAAKHWDDLVWQNLAPTSVAEQNLLRQNPELRAALFTVFTLTQSYFCGQKFSATESTTTCQIHSVTYSSYKQFV